MSKTHTQKEQVFFLIGESEQMQCTQMMANERSHSGKPTTYQGELIEPSEMMGPQVALSRGNGVILSITCNPLATTGHKLSMVYIEHRYSSPASWWNRIPTRYYSLRNTDVNYIGYPFFSFLRLCFHWVLEQKGTWKVI